MEKIGYRGDARGYHQLAITLITEHKFGTQKDGKSESIRTPLYPMFIGFFYLLFGFHSWIALAVQVLIDTCSCGLIYFFLSRFLNAYTSLWGAFFYAIDPYLILYSTKLWSETLFIFFLILALLLFVQVPNYLNDIKMNYFYSAASGFFLGLSVLTRPIALYIPFLIAIWFLFTNQKYIKRAFRQVIVFLFLFFLTVLPWIIRNEITFKTPRLSTAEGFNLLALYVAPMEAEKKYISIDSARTSLFLNADSIIRNFGIQPETLNDFQKIPYWRKYALNIIRHNHVDFIRYMFYGIVNCMFSPGVKAFSQPLGFSMQENSVSVTGKNFIFSHISDKISDKNIFEIVIFVYIMIYLFTVYFLAIIGFIKMDKNKYLFLLLFLVVYFIFSAGPSGYSRFRVPAIPFYLSFVGIGSSWILSKWKK